MSRFKNNKQEVEKFEFNQFSSPSAENSDVSLFNFETIDPGKAAQKKVVDEKTIRVERDLATKNDFKVDSHVQNYRGFKSQEKEDFQNKLDEALKEQYDDLAKKAYEEGLALGREEGKTLALEEAAVALEDNISRIVTTLEDITSQKDKILSDHKESAYSILKNISKWVALKEIKEDESAYLEKLLVKLVSEINIKNNLNIKVSQQTYDLMPEIIQAAEKQVGVLGNIRYEVSPEIVSEGIIIESQNGIIDASLEAQFSMIDNIFNQGE